MTSTPPTGTRPRGVSGAPTGPVPSGRGPGRVAALDGLRGIAVLSVLVFHAWPTLLPGGFVGVDMFFVLSGFLITTGIVRGVDGGQGLRLRSFWTRRIRRLVPGMLIALVSCTALAWLAVAEFPAGLGRQWLGALTYTSNWVMIADGGDYFAHASPPLFQHLWSLAIEEQFYVLWPLLVGGLCLLVRPRREGAAAARRSDAVRVLVVALLAAASAAAMVVGSLGGTDQTRLYFGTDTHAFGLLAGACVSLALAHAVRPEDGGPPVRTGPVRTGVAWLALGALAVGFVTVDGADAATYRGVLVGLSALVALLVWHVVQGSREDSLSRALRAPVLRWWGRRSYAAYLWHWPLLVILRVLVPVDAPGWAEPVAAGAVLLLTAGIADLSTRLIEEPVLRQGIRRSLDRGDLAFTRRLRGSHGAASRLAAAGAAVLLAAVPAAAAAAVVHSPAQTRLEQDIAAAEQALLETQAQQREAREARRSRQAEAAAASPSGSPTSPSPSGAPSSGAPSPDPGASETGAASASPSSSAPSSGAASPLGNPAVTRPEFTREELTAALPPSDLGARTTLVGDSVALSAAPALLEEMPDVIVDATVGRQVWDAADRIGALDTEGALGDVVVASFGANGSGSSKDWNGVLDAVGEDRLLVVVVPHGPQEWVPEAQRQAVRLAEENPARVVLADWDAVAVRDVTDFSADGVHPRAEGQALYARLVRLTVETRLGTR